MDVKPKYTEVRKYDIDDFFIENLQDIEFPLSVRIAEFIEKNLRYIPSSNLVSYVVGGLVMYNNKPVAFALELVRPLGDNPILSDIEIISMDETRAEKISVMRNDSQMYCRRNVRRLDLVSKLTTAQPTYLQRGQRKLRESVENYNYNSLTAAAWEKSTLLASKMTSASNSYFTSLSSVYQAKK